MIEISKITNVITVAILVVDGVYLISMSPIVPVCNLEQIF